MPDDLFSALDEDRRDRLRALGWHEAGCLLSGRPCWRRPDLGCVVEEPEAFAWLDRHEAGEQG